jgi:Fe-S cluster assembly protein SufB
MSKYTEDDLKSNSKPKNTSTDFTPESETFPIGLNEDIVRAILTQKKNLNDDRLAY